jgi:hypothetical protein
LLPKTKIITGKMKYFSSNRNWYRQTLLFVRQIICNIKAAGTSNAPAALIYIQLVYLTALFFALPFFFLPRQIINPVTGILAQIRLPQKANILPGSPNTAPTCMS